MLIDLISTDNQVTFNIKLAHIIGLHPAIYAAELININNKAIRKNKINEHYFKIDRQYLTQKTTFSEEEQLEIENILVEFKLISKLENQPNTIQINLEVLTTIFMNTDEHLVNNLKTLIDISNTKKNKKTKTEIIKDNLKLSINCENTELCEAYKSWIDGVYANPKGFLSKRAIQIFQKTVDEFSQHNLDTALTIIDIATVNGYRDATWAISKYTQNTIYKNNRTVTNNKLHSNLSSEVF